MPLIQSTRFGAIDVDAGDVIHFPAGLIGLGGSSYALVPAAEGSPFCWLQSADDPALALPLTDPWLFFPDFELALSDEATAAAGLPDGDGDVRVWVTVRAAADPRAMTANLKAPIVVHAGRGHQVLNEAAGAPVRAPLFRAAGAAAA